MRLPVRSRKLADCARFRLKDALSACPVGAWNLWTLRQTKYRVHEATRSIPIRWLEDAGTWRPGLPMQVLQYLYAGPEMISAAEACVEALEEQLGGIAVKVMLTELAQGAAVLSHKDSFPSIDVSHRCHVPIRTNSMVEFLIDGENQRLEEEVAYEIDNTRVHSVANNGPTSRVHLICDIVQGESDVRFIRIEDGA